MHLTIPSFYCPYPKTYDLPHFADEGLGAQRLRQHGRDTQLAGD